MELRNPQVHIEGCRRRTWLLFHRRFIIEQTEDFACVRTKWNCTCRSSSRPICQGPGPAGMGFYTWAVLLPFHWTLFISVMSKQSVPELTTLQSFEAGLAYRTEQREGGPRGPAQAKECGFRVLLHKFNQHNEKEIIRAFVMIWKGGGSVSHWLRSGPVPGPSLTDSWTISLRRVTQLGLVLPPTSTCPQGERL